MALDFPDSPSDGQYYEGFVWNDTSQTWRVTKLPAGASFEYVVVGGGAGGGGSNTNGANMPGGGAGGYRSNVSGENSGGGFTNEIPLELPSGSYTVTIGAGGAGGAQSNYTLGALGGYSEFGPIISYGGSGGVYGAVAPTDPGASTGGGNQVNAVALRGQGFLGQYTTGAGGGGGGAGEVGGTDGANQGGDGVASSITGSSVFRAGGGGGAPSGAGGDGGGGTGGNSSSGTAGTANTGGGGGGGGYRAGSAGGSGVVILKYADSLTLTIGAGLTSSTTTSGGYKVTTFTAGTDTVSF